MSYLEEEMVMYLKHHKIDDYIREYRFAVNEDPPRRWRFDFAWVPELVAVEIDGGVHAHGRHQRPAGFLADRIKYESALRLGWRVYQVPGPWLVQARRRVWRDEIADTLRVLLDHKVVPK